MSAGGSDKAAMHFQSNPRYHYMKLIGHGAYGLVAMANDAINSSSVAIKRINQISNTLVARRTLRELRLLRHFKGHPNIIQILDLYSSNDSNIHRPILRSNTMGGFGAFEELFLVEELMEADLGQVLQSKYPIGDTQQRQLMRSLLSGVSAMHSADVLHRDLKPGNLLWRSNGELKICDFGLARGIDETVEAKDLALTAYVATRWYRPPEVLLYRTPYGKPLDMWAVGCIFAELLSRQVFLPAQSSIDQLNLIFSKLGTPPEDVISRIPSQRSMSYLRRLKRQEGKPMRYWFPKASAEALDLMEGLLKFDPRERLTAEQALLHPYFAEYQHQHNNTINPTPYIPSRFDFSFDERCKTLADLKSAIWEELKLYRKPTILQMSMEIQKSVRLDDKDPLTSSGGRLSVEAEALASIKPTLQRQSRFRRVEK